MSKKSFLNELEENVIAVGIIIMVIMEVLNVACRLINPALEGIAEEIAIFAYTFVCFLCASYCTKKGENIIVDVLTNKYGKKIQNSLKLIECVMDSIVSILFLYGAILVVISTKVSGEIGITGIPLWLIYTAPLFGFGLNLMRNIQKIVKEVRRINNKSEQLLQDLNIG